MPYAISGYENLVKKISPWTNSIYEIEKYSYRFNRQPKLRVMERERESFLTDYVIWLAFQEKQITDKPTI